MRVTFLAVTKAIKASSQLEGIQSVHLPGRLAKQQSMRWLPHCVHGQEAKRKESQCSTHLLLFYLVQDPTP